MYSQNNEEAVIGKHFSGFVGRFLEIGAHDGKTFSNTLRLVEQGWSGVCVEASPVVFPKLLELHRHNSKIALVNAPVSAGPSQLVTWYDSNGDGVSSTSLDHVKRWESGSGVRFTPFSVYTMPLQALLDAYGYDFNFVNIDVESTNLDLFNAMPWPLLKQLKLVCVEHDRNVEHMLNVLNPYDFRLVDLNAENLIMAR